MAIFFRLFPSVQLLLLWGNSMQRSPDALRRAGPQVIDLENQQQACTSNASFLSAWHSGSIRGAANPLLVVR